MPYEKEHRRNSILSAIFAIIGTVVLIGVLSYAIGSPTAAEEVTPEAAPPAVTVAPKRSQESVDTVLTIPKGESRLVKFDLANDGFFHIRTDLLNNGPDTSTYDVTTILGRDIAKWNHGYDVKKIPIVSTWFINRGHRKRWLEAGPYGVIITNEFNEIPLEVRLRIDNR